jgi:Na+-driven multidrug efflux pump
LLFYFLSKTFYYSCFSFLAYKKNPSFSLLTQIILGLANLMLNILLIYAFFCSSKKTGVKHGNFSGNKNI